MTTMRARWVPYWYNLDYSLEVGEARPYLLVHDIPTPRFHSGLGDFPDEPWDFVYGRVLSISHPGLGGVEAVLTEALGYEIRLADGETLRVDSEEQPGAAQEGSGVDDWTMTVTLEPVREPLMDAIARGLKGKELLGKNELLLLLEDAADVRANRSGALSGKALEHTEQTRPDLLGEAFDSEHDDVRYYLATRLQALGRKAEKTADALLERVRVEDGRVAWRAAQALCVVAPERLLLLRKVLRTKSDTFRKQTLHYVSRIPGFGKGFCQTLTDDSGA